MRNERDVPLFPVVVGAIRSLVAGRPSRPVFRQRRYTDGNEPPLAGRTVKQPERELDRRAQQLEAPGESSSGRENRAAAAQKLWREMGALKEDWIRIEFMRVTKRIGISELTAPKLIRHAFATTLQVARVDPLVRNELLGHVAAGARVPIAGLGKTAVYTHTKPATKQRQLEQAFADHPVVRYARERLGHQAAPSPDLFAHHQEA